ncbi:uncharacterized protein MYCFIDRAFT_172611 [Pseudocercospora fijiensis CIRAD86]|uniref:Uncharacterized protein n=1 Tax=Pseudocercospora fijiensis (strain CIRAD86) TaxID=383855 RepID=M2ZAR7_PSEFD|nr:uncharacterized protein MYCFIDRAFT_172611 [Pseudocercospora fijiensis CIRAD86]EME86920.1 hypothetical protein MYCFIDRAFT_172611 [Pseudocercospora fijiensis CIRAD86]
MLDSENTLIFWNIGSNPDLKTLSLFLMIPDMRRYRPRRRQRAFPSGPGYHQHHQYIGIKTTIHLSWRAEERTRCSFLTIHDGLSSCDVKMLGGHYLDNDRQRAQSNRNLLILEDQSYSVIWLTSLSSNSHFLRWTINTTAGLRDSPVNVLLGQSGFPPDSHNTRSKAVNHTTMTTENLSSTLYNLQAFPCPSEFIFSLCMAYPSNLPPHLQPFPAFPGSNTIKPHPSPLPNPHLPSSPYPPILNPPFSYLPPKSQFFISVTCKNFIWKAWTFLSAPGSETGVLRFTRGFGAVRFEVKWRRKGSKERVDKDCPGVRVDGGPEAE